MCGNYQEGLCLNDSAMSVWENIVWQKTKWVEQCLPDSEEPQQGWLRMLILYPFFIVYREVAELVGRLQCKHILQPKWSQVYIGSLPMTKQVPSCFLSIQRSWQKLVEKKPQLQKTLADASDHVNEQYGMNKFVTSWGFVLVNRLHEMNGWSYGRRPVICRSIQLQKFIELLATWEFLLTKHDA